MDVVKSPRELNSVTRLRWYQYRLRTLLIAMLLVACVLAWNTVKVRRQRAAIAAISAVGGRVSYTEPWGPKWAVDYLGHDFLATAVSVGLNGEEMLQAGPITEEEEEVSVGTAAEDKRALQTASRPLASAPELAPLAALRNLQRLKFTYMRLGEADLRQIAKLSRLTHLTFNACEIDEAGLATLSEARNLRYLKVSNRHVHRTALESLAARLPNCRVDR